MIHPFLYLLSGLFYNSAPTDHMPSPGGNTIPVKGGQSSSVVTHCAVVDFIPDPRTIKVKSGNSLVDYLQIKLWFEHNSATVIRHTPVESHQSLNLQFVDFISHIIWSRYEFNESSAFNIVKSGLLIKHLFF